MNEALGLSFFRISKKELTDSTRDAAFVDADETPPHGDADHKRELPSEDFSP